MPVTGCQTNPNLGLLTGCNSTSTVVTCLTLTMDNLVRELSLKLSTLMSVSVSSYNRHFGSVNTDNRQKSDLSGDLTYRSTPSDDLNYLAYFYLMHPLHVTKFRQLFQRYLSGPLQELGKAITGLHQSFEKLHKSFTLINTSAKDLAKSVTKIKSLLPGVSNKLDKIIQKIGQTFESTNKESMKQVKEATTGNGTKIDSTVKNVEAKIPPITKSLECHVKQELVHIKTKFKQKFIPYFTKFHSSIERDIQFIEDLGKTITLELKEQDRGKINKLIEVVNRRREMQGEPLPTIDPQKLGDLSTLNKGLKALKQEITKANPSGFNITNIYSGNIDLTYEDFDKRENVEVHLEPFTKYISGLRTVYTKKINDKKNEIQGQLDKVNAELEKAYQVKKEIDSQQILKNYLDNGEGLQKIQGLINTRHKIQKLLTNIGEVKVKELERQIESLKSQREPSTTLSSIEAKLRLLKDNEKNGGKEGVIYRTLKSEKTRFKEEVKKKFISLIGSVNFISGEDTIDYKELLKINLLISDLGNYYPDNDLEGLEDSKLKGVTTLNKNLKKLGTTLTI